MMAAVALGRDWLQGSLTGQPAESHRCSDRQAWPDPGSGIAARRIGVDASGQQLEHRLLRRSDRGGCRAAVGSSLNCAREVIDVATQAMVHGLSAYSPDGGWPEGPSYWEYATRYAAFAIAALEEAGLDSRKLGGVARPCLDMALWAGT